MAGIYTNITCKKEKKKQEFSPLKHQTDTLNYFLKSEYKGLFLFHKLGSGKSCTAFLIADTLLRQ